MHTSKQKSSLCPCSFGMAGKKYWWLSNSAKPGVYGWGHQNNPQSLSFALTQKLCVCRWTVLDGRVQVVEQTGWHLDRVWYVTVLLIITFHIAFYPIIFKSLTRPLSCTATPTCWNGQWCTSSAVDSTIDEFKLILFSLAHRHPFGY